MSDKRTIRGEQYNISQIVDDAVNAANSMALDTESARQALMRLGHRNPDDAVINQYAHEVAILKALQKITGANFTGQIGKISFANRERTVQDVQDYLNRRNQGQHARWTAR